MLNVDWSRLLSLESLLTTMFHSLAMAVLVRFSKWVLASVEEPPQQKQAKKTPVVRSQTLKTELMKLLAYSLLAFAGILTLSAVSSSIVNRPALPPSAIRGSVKFCSFIIDDPSKCGIIFTLRLANPGSPSTVWNWKLRVTIPSGQEFTSHANDSPHLSGFTATDSEFGITNGLNFNINNYLPVSLIQRPVAPDLGAEGWVLFILQVPWEHIRVPGTKFRIEFEQADGSIRGINHTWTVEPK
jgi:hypothetical protein